MTRNLTRLLPFIIGVVGIGALIGILSTPGPWYEQLNKPEINPPDWVFGPVWTILYILIGFVGWRLMTHRRSVALRILWGLQMGLNFLWSPVFFRLHEISWALIVISALLVTIAAFIAVGWNRDRLSALLFIPYLLWVGFATFLNVSFYHLNP